MRFLLIHLSDIHFQTEDDIILKRREQIESAIKNIDYEIDAAFVVVTGDLAFSGNEEQYVLAYEFCEKFMVNLSKKLAKPHCTPIPVYFIGVPGNHDCDFSEPNKLRAIIAENTLSDPNNAKNKEIVAISTLVQEHYFKFIEAISGKLKGASCDYSPELIYEYIFNFDGEQIRFICCNTAWLSQIDEAQGKLVFPYEAIPVINSTEDLIITLFHHPYNWLESNCARNFQKKIEQVADIILTGHEHDSTRHTKECSGGERNTYVEGGVLQSGSGLNSDFNLFVIDTKLKKQKFAHFIWDGTKYAIGIGSTLQSNSSELSWEEYQASRLRQRTLFEINREMQGFLNDPGAMIKSKNGKSINLSDFYLFPDFREIDPLGKISETITHGEDFIRIINDHPHIIITGNDQSGKTSLAKMLFLEFHHAGNVPIFVDGNKHISDNFFKVFERLFIEQYNQNQLSEYQRLDKNRRVIIVDDYHKINIHPKQKNKLISALASFAGKIILIGHDLELVMSELRNPIEIAEPHRLFVNYCIQQFGLSKRNRLVEKWLLLNSDEDVDAVDFAHKSMSINRTLNAIIGRNFVPAYPVYIVSVLNTSEAVFPVDTRASHQAYYYELFIRMALLQGRTEIEYDLIAAYLSNVAFAFFQGKLTEVSYEQLVQIHSEYEAKYDIHRPFDRMVEQLEAQRILESRDGIYKFKYKFIYYYFVATYIRDHIASPDIKSIITQLSGTLHIEENANILLFLTHLSKDPLIIEKLIEEAGKHFDDLEQANFERDAVFLYSGEHDFEPLLLEEKNASEARHKMLEAQDNLADDINANGDTNVYKDSEFSLKLNAAMKTLQILGQIIKNFPGSMESDDKIRIMETCIQLGLRISSSFFEFIKAMREDYIECIIQILKENTPELNQEELKKKAFDTMMGLAEFISFCLVKRISYDVGSPDLFKTYVRLEKPNNTPALSTILSSIKIDYTNKFPVAAIEDQARRLKQYPLAFAILRMLVYHHFTLFPVEYKIRQRLCPSLKITLAQTSRINPEVRLIGP